MLSEISVLFILAASGVLIGLLFDGFRILRRTFKMPDFMIYIQDVLFWILSGLIIIYILCDRLSGEIRLYMILMIIISMSLYFLTISKYVIQISMKIVSIIKSAIAFIFKPFKHIISNFRDKLKTKKRKKL